MQDQLPLDNQEPQGEPVNAMPLGDVDHEGAMAKADLYKLANYSLKLFKQIEDNDQLEAWVQAKITKAADYIASVYHYVEYEMKFSDYGSKLDNSDVYNESQKTELKNKLMEAKEKIKALKIKQADKQSGKKVEEGVLSGGHKTCEACGGSGSIYEEPKAIPDHVKGKVEKYKRLTKATHAAHKRLDKNNNGIPDNLEDKEVEEGFGDSGEKEMKVGDTKKTRTGELTKTSTGVIHKNTSYADDGEAEQKSGKGTKSHAKSQSAAEKKDRAPAQKKSKTGTWGMENSEKFDNRPKEKAVGETFGQGVYAEGKKPDFLDMDKDGNKKEPMKKAVADKKKNPFGNKKVSEAVKKAKKDYDKDGKIESEKDEVIGSRRKAAGLDEGNMPQDMDGATAAPAKGKDGQYPIITSGPNKGKRWSPTTPGPTNPAIKESEVIAESADLNRLKELTQKLLG